MANARFIYTDWMRTAAAQLLTNTVGAWLTTRPQTFILHPWRKKVARSANGTGNVDIVIDLLSARTFNCAFLIQPKLHAGGGTVRIQANATNAWTSPSFDSGAFPVVDVDRRLTGLYFADQTYRYVRILWTNTGAVNDYVELGYLMLGSYYEPTYNITDQLVKKPTDPSVVNEAYDGEQQVSKRTHYYVVNFFLESMPPVDVAALEAMYAAIGISHPLVLTLDSSVLNETYYGYIKDCTFNFAKGTINEYDVAGQFAEAR